MHNINKSETEAEKNTPKTESESHLITVSLKSHPVLEAQIVHYASSIGLKKAEIVRRALTQYMADPKVQEQLRIAGKQ